MYMTFCKKWPFLCLNWLFDRFNQGFEPWFFRFDFCFHSKHTFFRFRSSFRSWKNYGLFSVFAPKPWFYHCSSSGRFVLLHGQPKRNPHRKCVLRVAFRLPMNRPNPTTIILELNKANRKHFFDIYLYKNLT